MILIQSDFSQIIGAYSPFEWKNYDGFVISKEIKPFLFYFDKIKLRVCKAKPDKEVGIWSDEVFPISFGNSKFSYFKIKVDRE